MNRGKQLVPKKFVKKAKAMIEYKRNNIYISFGLCFCSFKLQKWDSYIINAKNHILNKVQIYLPISRSHYLENAREYGWDVVQ